MTEIAKFGGPSSSADNKSVADAAVAQLMSRVGDRVRKAREQKGISRRVLSEISGVSPRYLAQLESGNGNISIGLLKRVAVALDHRVEWIVGEEDPWTSEALRVADLYRLADRKTQKSVLRSLSPTPLKAHRANRICLIGLRGAGKSTLGRLISTKLDLPFVELNKEIENHGGMPVAEIMALYGQEGYRRLEFVALDRIVATHDKMILAVAGGIAAEPETYNRLLMNFHTVWVKASPSEHMDRVKAQGDNRPMAGNPEAMAQLKSILNSREALYDRALVQLDTSGASVDGSLNQLRNIIKERRFLD